jgi:DeoR family transcriptional regulator, suf operon transcriptional repressor
MGNSHIGNNGPRDCPEARRASEGKPLSLTGSGTHGCFFHTGACQNSAARYSQGMAQTASQPEARHTDQAVIDLLRVDEAMGVGELASALGVTATAVRQRLDRLMRNGFVERQAMGGRRGRPSHAYSLTAQGRRVGGDNFRDLAFVLWRELRGVKDPAVRRGLLGRIGAGLAEIDRGSVVGDTPTERLVGVADLLRRRQVACGVEPQGDGGLPVLTTYSCPYPDLAEADRGICAAERSMIEELVGGSVRLSECRLDGGSCCRFTVSATAGIEPADSAAEPHHDEPLQSSV